MENRITGFSANMMMLGREVTKPVNIIYGQAGNNSPEYDSPVEYVKKLTKTLQDVHESACSSL